VKRWRGLNFMDEKVRTAWVQAAALGVLIWETVIERLDRPYLLAVVAGLLGLPYVPRKSPPPPPKPDQDSPTQPD
jgi:hypothetical protein